MRATARATARALELGAVTVVLLAIAGPSSSHAALSLDATACTGSDVSFGLLVMDAPHVTTSDCTIGFGTDTGKVQLRAYQQDGAGSAMPGIADIAAGTSDWGPGDELFGACLRRLSAVPTTSWGIPGDGTCDPTASDPWKPIPAVSGDTGSIVAEMTTGTYSADLRFGVRFGASTPAGAYSAPIVIEVIQPVPAPPTNSALPVISGTTTVGQVLSTTNGTWTGSPSSYAYQWRRCDAAGSACADIGGATSNTYTLVAADVNATLRVVVTATNGDGSTPATSAQTVVIAGIAPTAGTAAVAGTATTGQTLTASTGGTWTAGTPAAGATTWQWRRCDAAGTACADIAGATASTYLLVAADVDSTIRVVASRTNSCTIGCGTASATSVQTARIAGIAPTAGTVSVSGIAGKGKTLSANSAGWTSGTPTGTTTWQWRRCDASGGSCVDIAGATSSSYVVAAADLDSTIRVAMSITNTCAIGCGAATATSTQTAVILAITNPATTNTTSSSTSATLAVPPGSAPGDVLVVVITTRDGSDQNIQEQTTSHWTKYIQHNNSDRVAIAVFYRVVDGTETASYSFRWTNSRGSTATMLAFTGVDIMSPIGGRSLVTGNGGTQTIPELTGTDPRSMLVAAYTARNATGSYSTPGGMTEILDTNTTDVTSSISTQQWPAGGATGSRATTGPIGESAGILFWMNPD